MGDKCDQCTTDYYESADKECSVCPNGWFYYKGDQVGDKGACYKVSGVKKTFEEAKAACLAETDAKSKLFEPKSEAENQAIFNIMKNMFGMETEYFVGIEQDPDSVDAGVLKYVSDGTTVLLDIFPNTASRPGVNHCVAIDAQDFGLFWTDRYCTDKYSFVCQTKTVAELASAATPPGGTTIGR